MAAIALTEPKDYISVIDPGWQSMAESQRAATQYGRLHRSQVVETRQLNKKNKIYTEKI